jgi:hypothetical protein
MKIGHKHYVLIVTALLTFIVSGFSYYILYRNISIQYDSTRKAFSELIHQKDIKNNEEKLSDLYNKSEKDRGRISNLVVSQDQIVNFIEHIEKIGDSANVSISISDISSENIKDKGGDLLRARVTANGSWASIMKALIGIENMPYAVLVNDLRISTGGGDVSVPTKSSTKIWSISLIVRVLANK